MRGWGPSAATLRRACSSSLFRHRRCSRFLPRRSCLDGPFRRQTSQAANQAVGRLLEAYVLVQVTVGRRNRAFEAPGVGRGLHGPGAAGRQSRGRHRCLRARPLCAQATGLSGPGPRCVRVVPALQGRYCRAPIGALLALMVTSRLWSHQPWVSESYVSIVNCDCSPSKPGAAQVRSSPRIALRPDQSPVPFPAPQVALRPASCQQRCPDGEARWLGR